MSKDDVSQQRLEQLRRWKNRPQRDLGLGDLQKQFKREIEKPYKQVGAVVELWEQMLPPELLAHTRLEGLQRGILRVAVNGSSRLYELDRLLRQGLERQLIHARKGTGLRKVKLQLGQFFDEPQSG